MAQRPSRRGWKIRGYPSSSFEVCIHFITHNEIIINDATGIIAPFAGSVQITIARRTSKDAAAIQKPLFGSRNAQ